MLRAILFDFDGVIVDSETHHLRAFRRVLQDEGMTLSDEDYYAIYLGLDDKHCFRAVMTDRGRAPDDAAVQALVDRKAAYYADCQDGVVILPGAPAFVRQAAVRYPLAIASGALRREIEYALDRAGLRTLFSVIVSAEDVAHSKPAPDGYLTALARLNALRSASQPRIQAAECVVIEDAIRGIAAARAAGMRCAAVTSTYSEEVLGEADLVVFGLDALTVEMLDALA